MKEAIKKLLDMSVGELREQLAYDDGDESIQEVFEDMFEHELDNGQSLEDYLNENYGAENDQYDDDDNEDDDYSYDDDDEEEEEDPDYLNSDEVCIGGALSIPEEEELAQSIAADIRNGRYALHTLNGVYSVEILNRISELI